MNKIKLKKKIKKNSRFICYLTWIELNELENNGCGWNDWS